LRDSETLLSARVLGDSDTLLSASAIAKKQAKLKIERAEHEKKGQALIDEDLALKRREHEHEIQGAELFERVAELRQAEERRNRAMNGDELENLTYPDFQSIRTQQMNTMDVLTTHLRKARADKAELSRERTERVEGQRVAAEQNAVDDAEQNALDDYSIEPARLRHMELVEYNAFIAGCDASIAVYCAQEDRLTLEATAVLAASERVDAAFGACFESPGNHLYLLKWVHSLFSSRVLTLFSLAPPSC